MDNTKKYLPQGYEVDEFVGCYLAGGAILSRFTKKEVSDFDLYPKSKEAMMDAVFTVLDDSDKFIVNVTDKAITFKMNNITDSKGNRAVGQIMTYDTFETPEKIFENFDFTVCMGAFDIDTKEHTLHPAFFPDIASKTLRFNPKTRYPLNSLLRINKYKEKGYYISKPEMTRMILTAMNAGMPQSWKELEQQIGGTYGREIELHSKDKEYSFEAALEVLEELSFVGFQAYDRAEEFKKADETTFDVVFNAEKYRRFEIPRMGRTTLNENRRILYNIDTQEIIQQPEMLDEILEIMGLHIDAIDDGPVKGYKKVKETPDGDFVPPSYSASKGFKYAPVGEETVEEKYPHLYFFPQKQNLWSAGSHIRYFIIETKLSDIRYVSGGEATTRAFVLNTETDN